MTWWSFGVLRPAFCVSELESWDSDLVGERLVSFEGGMAESMKVTFRN
jgi:hypothetical protein